MTRDVRVLFFFGEAPPHHLARYICIYIHICIYNEPSKPTFLEVLMVNNMVFRWPKPLFFMVLGAHGIYILQNWVTHKKQFSYLDISKNTP